MFDELEGSRMKVAVRSLLDRPVHSLEIRRLISDISHLSRQFAPTPSMQVSYPGMDVDFKAVGQALVADRKRFSEVKEWRRRIDKKGTVVGESPVLYAVFEALTDAVGLDDEPAVLLLGETGVGKTMLARMIHDSSKRAGKRYLEVNAAGTGGDANIQRGEWIGYGSQHGINGIDRKGKQGHLMRVREGTLFVDEFALFSKELQGIFLSVLEGSGVQKVGGETFSPDVRCIFASNADLGAVLARGEMRRDLLARIPVKIKIPPLADRGGDIPALVRHFAGINNPLSQRSLLALLTHSWPENVREVTIVMNAAIQMKRRSGASRIDLEHLQLPDHLTRSLKLLPEAEVVRKLWTLADEIAREEGYESGKGRQRRAGEILGVGQAQASKKYSACGISTVPSS